MRKPKECEARKCKAKTKSFFSDVKPANVKSKTKNKLVIQPFPMSAEELASIGSLSTPSPPPSPKRSSAGGRNDEHGPNMFMNM